MKCICIAFTCILLSVFFSTKISAQPVVHAGIRTGLSLSYVETKGIRAPHLMLPGTEYVHPDMVGNLGVFMNVPVIKGFSIQAEGNWQPMGFRHEYTDFGVQERQFNLTYLTVPIFVKYSKWGIGLLGGLQYSWLLSAKQKEDGGFQNIYSTDVKPDMKKTDMGWVAGLEYTFRFGLGINFRYYQGISNFALPRTFTFHTRNAVYNRSMQVFGIHYRIIGNEKRK